MTLCMASSVPKMPLPEEPEANKFSFCQFVHGWRMCLWFPAGADYMWIFLPFVVKSMQYHIVRELCFFVLRELADLPASKCMCHH
jgi:hypothetical protein